MNSLKTLTLSFFCFCCTSALFGQFTALGQQHNHAKGPLLFIENQQQWPDDVLFKTTFDGSHTLFIEENGYTFLLTSSEDLSLLHANHKQSIEKRQAIDIKQHAYKVKFVGSQPSQGTGIAKRSQYHNYYLGDDPSRWSHHVPLYGKVVQKALYPGIDLETYSQKSHLKYDLIVAPNADPSIIQLSYTGLERMELIEGALHLTTSIGVIQELHPVAWQEIDGQRINVPCYFSLEENVVGFTFPEAYDPSFELVIDPTIIASTLTGTTGDSGSIGNWGHSATFDNGGNIYGAGISFVTTFPTTVGAFQTNWAGGTNDMAIIKYTPDGSDMLFATYIGGSGDDFPHSIIADFNQQVYIYGSSNSQDYPTTSNAYQPDSGGGIDIVVSILNQDGSALVGSSFFGGSADDGFNNNASSPNFSPGDQYRGEIVIDGQNNVYVVSSTQSSNFPVTSNAFDQTFNTLGSPDQDAVVIKANSDLSLLYWASYLGGAGLDSGNGIRVDDSGQVYVTGTTSGTDFPTTPGTIQSTWPGGNESGYLSIFSADGTSMVASTYYGSTNDDNAYFLDIDEDDQVHIYGKTKGIMPIFPANVYSGVPGSNQFLAAFDAALTTTIYSTVIGNGPNAFSYDFIPVAFMVDKCNGIYFSGYEAFMGLPTTAGSFPDLIPGANDFYLGVLKPNATDLEFATYYGEADHVDGGTSRFDKGGVIYQGVCSCDWSGNLTTLPNAWASDQQTGCDIGVFKIDLEIDAINANGIAFPSTAGCVPFEVDFVFTGTNATTFEWSIDTNVISNLPNHTYTFTEPGTYQVSLAVSNPSACNPVDTFNLEIVALQGQTTRTDTSFCVGDQLFLDATTPNAFYNWQDGSTAAAYTVDQPGVYWVDIDIGACERRDSFVVESASEVLFDIGPDSSFCDVLSFPIDANNDGVISYQWQDGSTSAIFNATEDGMYTVVGIDTNGCSIIDEINLVFGETPAPDLGIDSILCDGDELTLSPDLQNSLIVWQDTSTDPTFTVTTAGTYSITLDNDGCTASDSVEIGYYPPLIPNASANSIICANDCNGVAIVSPVGGSGMGYDILWSNGSTKDEVQDLCPGIYTVTITDSNNCTAEQTVEVTAPEVLEMVINLAHVECPGDMDGFIEVSPVTGGVAPYQFAFNNSGYSTTNGMGNLSGGSYEVFVLDENGCEISEVVEIEEPEAFVISAGQDIVIQLGDSTNLQAFIAPFINQEINWFPPDFLNCIDCISPTLCPTQTTLYTLTVTDPESGCFLMDSVLVSVDKERRVYIPNAFSPNDDGSNDFFTVYAGTGVERIAELKVFDRWGELVFENYNFEPNDVTNGWNGTLKGENLNPAVFVYYTKVLFKDETVIQYNGDIHLIR